MRYFELNEFGFTTRLSETTIDRGISDNLFDAVLRWKTESSKENTYHLLGFQEETKRLKKPAPRDHLFRGQMITSVQTSALVRGEHIDLQMRGRLMPWSHSPYIGSQYALSATENDGFGILLSFPAGELDVFLDTTLIRLTDDEARYGADAFDFLVREEEVIVESNAPLRVFPHNVLWIGKRNVSTHRIETVFGIHPHLQYGI